MKHTFSLKTLVGAVALAVLPGIAAAAGILSGSTVSNTATLSYDVGGVAQGAVESSPSGNSTPGAGNGTAITFLVDTKVDLTVAESSGSATQVIPSAAAQAVAFTVTNHSNTALDFALASANLPNGTTLTLGANAYADAFDGAGCATYVDSNANSVYEAGTDTASYVDELAADASVTVFAVCNVPANLINGSDAVVSMTATAREGSTPSALGSALAATVGAGSPSVVDVVFADAAGSDDAGRDAKHSARDAFEISTAVLTVSKTQALLCDPVNGTTNPMHIPGAIVRWTVTVSNSAAATASATLSQLSDVVAASTTFDPNLVTGAGTCLSATGTPESAMGEGFKLDVTGDTRPGAYPQYFSSNADTDGADFSTGTATVDYSVAMPAEGAYAVGELKPGESAVFSFNVTIN